MKIIFLLLIFSILCTTCEAPKSGIRKLIAQNDSLKAVIELGRIKDSTTLNSLSYPKASIEGTEVRTLESKFTLNNYDIYIKFPKNYDKGKGYPVLYVLDAEVNFGGVSYIVQRLIKDELIPEILVIGIAYQGEADEDSYYATRQLDFTPTIDKQFNRKAGGAPQFARFLEAELFPFVDGQFKTNPNDRALYGHSLGGLFGFYILFSKPGLFSKYILLSPSLWWDNKSIFKDMKTATPEARHITLYVATGEREGEMVNDQLKMTEQLTRKNLKSLLIESEILKNETHRSIFGAGFTNGLRSIYSEYNSHDKEPAN